MKCTPDAKAARSAPDYGLQQLRVMAGCLGRIGRVLVRTVKCDIARAALARLPGSVHVAAAAARHAAVRLPAAGASRGGTVWFADREYRELLLQLGGVAPGALCALFTEQNGFKLVTTRLAAILEDGHVKTPANLPDGSTAAPGSAETLL